MQLFAPYALASLLPLFMSRDDPHKYAHRFSLIKPEFCFTQVLFTHVVMESATPMDFCKISLPDLWNFSKATGLP
jgi:hypothetical protein